jgi:hypothetical protein
MRDETLPTPLTWRVDMGGSDATACNSHRHSLKMHMYSITMQKNNNSHSFWQADGRGVGGQAAGAAGGGAPAGAGQGGRGVRGGGGGGGAPTGGPRSAAGRSRQRAQGEALCAITAVQRFGNRSGEQASNPERCAASERRHIMEELGCGRGGLHSRGALGQQVPADAATGRGVLFTPWISGAGDNNSGNVAQGLEAQAQRLQSDIAAGQTAAERASADAAAAAAAVKQLEADIEADVKMKASARHVDLLQTKQGDHTAWSFLPFKFPTRCLHNSLRVGAAGHTSLGF